MKRVTTISLIQQAETLDEIRQPVMQETSSTIYATMLEITRTEWTAAQQQSLSPAARILVFFGDYHGEKIAEFNGKRYVIYRTYESGDYIELYLGERVGELNG